MAITEQIFKLRRRLQDFYDNNGAQLSAANQAFSDDELNDLIDDGVAETSLGARTYLTANTEDIPLSMLLARADGCLMLAQDESRRKLWELNNKIIDDTNSSKRLIEIARELRARYESHKKRELQKQIASVENRPAGGLLTVNPTVEYHYKRDFNNRDVARNKPRR